MKSHKFLSAVTAGLMTVSAFAASTPIFAAAPAITIEETVSVNNTNTNLVEPTLTFTPTVAPKTADLAANETAGVAGAVTFTGELTKDTTSSSATSYKYTGTVTVDESKFTHGGIYVYTVQEGASAYAGLENAANQTITLRVFVRSNAAGGYEVYGYTAQEAGGNKQEPGEGNGLTIALAADYNTYDLTIKKVLDGNMQNPDRDFDFSLTANHPEVNGTKPGTNYNFVPATGAVAEVAPGTAKTFQLKGGQSATLVGLSASDVFDLTETKIDGYEVQITTGGSTTTAASITNVTMGAADRTVEVKNKANSVTPTGVLRTFAPYAIMAGIGSLFLFGYFRRKREE